MAKFETGYDAYEQGHQDKWKKVGGMERIMQIIEAGWYQICQRKEQNTKMQAVRELINKDPRFKGILENARKQLGQK